MKPAVTVLWRVCFVCLLLCASWVSAVQANDQGARKVLMLHSYEPGNPWTDRLHKHLLAALRVASFPLEVSTEYLGTKRNHPQALYPYLADLLEARQLPKPDLLMVTDNNALEFVQQYRNRLFADVPIVFAGVNPLRDAWRHRDPRVTGVLENSDPTANLKLIGSLFPGLRKLVVITDQTRTGQIEKIRFQQALEAYPHSYQAELFESWTLQSLKQRLRTADDGTLFFLLSAYRDRNDLQISLQDAVTLLLNNSQVPVMSAWPAGLEAGLLGGVMTTAQLQAQAAAQMALDILRGRSVEQMPVTMTSPAVAMFNYEQLRRFNIDPKLLPPGSHIWNRPKAWYEQDVPSLYAWPISLTLGALLLFLLWLWLREQGRTHQARSSLLRCEDESQRLQSFFEHLPAPACFIDSRGRVARVNHEFTVLAQTTETGQTLSAYTRNAPLLAQRMQHASSIDFASTEHCSALATGGESFSVSLEAESNTAARQLVQLQHQLLMSLDTSADLPAACQALLAQLVAQYPQLGCVLQSWDAKHNCLHTLASVNIPRGYLLACQAQTFGAPMVAALKRIRVLSENISTDPHWQSGAEQALSAGLLACWSYPVVQQSRLLGVLSFYFTTEQAETPELLTLLETCSQLSAILISRQQSSRDGYKYAAALEQSPCMVMITDTQGVIEYVNGQFSAVTGYSREDALGRKPGILACAETPRSLYRNLWQSILSGLDWRGELFNRTKSGQQIRCTLSVSPLFNEQGQITHFIGISQDISAQYRTRTAEQADA